MHQTAAIIRNHDRRIIIGRCRNDEEEPRDRAAIAARSNRDRAAIVPPFAWNQISKSRTWSGGSRRTIPAAIDARSWPYGGAIVADRGEKRGAILGGYGS